MTLIHAFMVVAPTLCFLLLYGCYSLHRDLRFWRKEAMGQLQYIEMVERENRQLHNNTCPYCDYQMDLICGDCGRTVEEALSEIAESKEIEDET